MKKTKIVALAMVSAVALVGAGYAAWGTQITDSTTLNTGNWEVVLENDAPGDSLVAGDIVYNYAKNGDTITETGVKSQEGYYNYDKVDPTNQVKASADKGSDYVYTIAPEIDGNTVNFSFYNMHPGTEAITRFEIRNKGSIPAKIANIKVVKNSGKGLEDNQRQLANAIKVSGIFYKHTGYNSAVEIGRFSDVSLANLQQAMFNILKTVELKPQESVNFSPIDSDELEVSNLHFLLPASALEGNKGMNASLPIEIKFDFEQYNQVQPAQPIPAEPTSAN